MARKPKPWYRKDRPSWYVTIDGKRHDLGPDKKAAREKFHQLMSEPHRRVVRTESVVAIVDAFLEWCHNHHAGDTYEWYRYRLQRFADTYPDVMRPLHSQRTGTVSTELDGWITISRPFVRERVFFFAVFCLTRATISAAGFWKPT